MIGHIRNTRALGLALALNLCAPAQAGPPAIMGKWATKPYLCSFREGAIGVGPMELTSDDFQCTFESMREMSGYVTWKGRCLFGLNESAAEVEAHLVDGMLHLRVNGADNGAYRRCQMEQAAR
jgi:hypothetical protein